MPDPDDLALALALADVADEMTMAQFRTGELAVETKPDLSPVTEADRAVERTLRERLAAARSGDSVVGEEYGESGPPGGRRWIVDPIDGTQNYVRGIPVWATLIALHVEGAGAVGVVSAPALARRWWALRGDGAFMQDGPSRTTRRLEVSRIAQLADAQLCISGLDGWPESDSGVPAVVELGRRCWRTRGFGDFWGYMLVAEGVAEICCEPEVSLWDLAAPQAIVEEAGGSFTDLTGDRTAGGGDALATNGLLHDAALAVVGRQPVR